MTEAAQVKSGNGSSSNYTGTPLGGSGGNIQNSSHHHNNLPSPFAKGKAIELSVLKTSVSQLGTISNANGNVHKNDNVVLIKDE